MGLEKPTKYDPNGREADELLGVYSFGCPSPSISLIASQPFFPFFPFSADRRPQPKDMKIFVKTLKGSHFEIQVDPEDTVADVKKHIETVQGAEVYPSGQQMLIHQGKVLVDTTKLSENNVAESSFLVIMLSKPKPQASGPSATPAATTTRVESSAPPAASSDPQDTPSPVSTTVSTSPASVASTPVAPAVTDSSEQNVYGEAASNLVSGSNLEDTIQSILDIGGGTWDRETVTRALRAAFNNPERAIEYLYSGIPERAEVPVVARPPSNAQAGNPPVTQAPLPTAAVPSTGPNANPLDLFPQGLPAAGQNPGAGTLDFLRNSPQFQALRAMVQANPQILQPMLQELGRQNPQLMRLIQDHQPDFLRLINEPVEGGAEGGNLFGDAAAALPQAIQVTPEEREAIERLEAMGFDRATVLEVYFACNKNEELAANFLLDHMNELDD